MIVFSLPGRQKKCEALDRFNEWEKQIIEKPDYADCLAALFELYDLVPDLAKQRPVNVEGIMKMRERLACLTQEFLKPQAEKEMPGAFSRLSISHRLTQTSTDKKTFHRTTLSDEKQSSLSRNNKIID
ncbi:hypothetical protein ACFL2E_09840 [Thermodesulfobacteriota bacterium]